MKRMSEVFKLPVQPINIEWIASVSTNEQNESIAHAINHVDALADALEAMISLVNNQKDGSMFRSIEYKESIVALAAYRGGK